VNLSEVGVEFDEYEEGNDTFYISLLIHCILLFNADPRILFIKIRIGK